MQTPQRKPGKYNHLKADPHLTEGKYLELQKKLERLEKFSQPRARAEVRRLAEMGDFSENVAYQIEKGRLRGMNQAITDIKDHLKRAIIIKPGVKTSTVQIGSTVTVLVNKKLKDYLILGSSETDPLKGIISHNSPIGSALLHRRVDDIIKVPVKNKFTEYRIVDIN